MIPYFALLLLHSLAIIFVFSRNSFMFPCDGFDVFVSSAKPLLDTAIFSHVNHMHICIYNTSICTCEAVSSAVSHHDYKCVHPQDDKSFVA